MHSAKVNDARAKSNTARRGQRSSEGSPAGKDVDNGVGIYPAAVAVESLYLFDMFLYTPEVAAVPTVPLLPPTALRYRESFARMMCVRRRY